MNQPVDLTIVGQIVSAIGLLYVFPSEAKIGEFLVALLTGVPGCHAASLCFRRAVDPIGGVSGEQCRDCARQRERLDNATHYACGLVEADHVQVYPIGTVIRLYGYLILAIENINKYRQYEPFVINLGNALAITLENRWQQEELQKAREFLERRVKERTAALHESEEWHRAILLTAMDGFWMLDMQGRVLEVNETYCRMSGYSEQELLAMNISDLEAGETASDIAAHFQKIMAQGEERFESRHRRKDGTIFDVEVSSQYRPTASGRCVAFLRDITERKRAEVEKAKLEAQLLHALKMESIGQLAGGVAHDFNNMLGVILGHTDLALDQVDPMQPIHASLVEINKAAERSANLTRQLLAFARKQTITPKVLDLNETVAGMLKMIERLIGEDIQLDWRPKANLWPVRVDPSQIDQILANLCVNARDAIAGVGKVTIETDTTTFDAEYCLRHIDFVPGDYVRIAVSDDGCGMDQETQSHIFEPFFTTKGFGEGTGLGLATVYGAVKQNKGFINVYSERGAGTTFSIYLPRHVGKNELPRAGDMAGPATRGQETILLVEDEPNFLNMTKMMLELLGYTVLAASTPNQAICLAKEYNGEIHLLLTDMIMPEMNGRDLAKYLLSLHPRLKRLFMSGYPAGAVAHHGMLDEGLHFIQKPFLKKELAAKVREVLDYRKA